MPSFYFSAVFCNLSKVQEEGKKKKKILSGSITLTMDLSIHLQFVTSMTMLRNAADHASRASLAYFDQIIGAPNGEQHQFTTTYTRALSVAPPVRATTEEPEGPLKRPRRKREKRDPDLPKRPMTAYLLFCNQGRETVKKDLGDGASHKDVIAELTRRWAEVPEDEKKVGFSQCVVHAEQLINNF